MKGQFGTELVLVLIIAFVFSISTIVSYKIMTEISPYLNQTEVGENITQSTMSAIGMFDFGAVLLILGMGISIVISGFLVYSHPIFVIPGIIIIVLLMLVAPAISNTFESFITSSEMSTTAANFGLIQIIMANLPLIIATFGILFLIVMYSKSRMTGV